MGAGRNGEESGGVALCHCQELFALWDLRHLGRRR